MAGSGSDVGNRGEERIGSGPVRVLVLAAGWATRLGPTSQGRPKGLLALGERAVIDIAVDRLDAVPAVSRIDIWTNEAFRPAFDDWAARRSTRAGLRVLSNGTASAETRLGAIADMAAFLEREDPQEPLLVVGADNAFDLSLDPLVEWARQQVCVVLHDVGSRAAVSRLASVAQHPDGSIQRLREKDPAPTGTLAATALYGLPVSAFGEIHSYLDEGRSADSMGSILEWWVSRRPVQGLNLPGRWIDVGTPEDLARARMLFAERSSK